MKIPGKASTLLNGHKGALTQEQIAAGLHLCYCNASDLFEEAKILLRNRKSARAFGLCVLCLEELAKIPLLSNAVLLKNANPAAWKKFWKAFAKHRLKQNIWSFYGKGSLLSRTERARFYKRTYPNALPSLERMKQLSFYVDYLDGGNAMKPEILFEHMKGLIGLVFKMAEDRLEGFRPLHSTPSKSKKAVAVMSRIKCERLSQEELEAMLFDSVRLIEDYSERV
jgi:AbiV family abortive infection protein